MKNISNFLYKTYCWIREHPIYSSLILFIPNAYFTILQICPEQLGLKYNNEITSFGIKLFWILLLLSFLMIFGKGLLDSTINKVVADSIARQRELMNSATHLINLKKERFVKYIQSNLNVNNCQVFSEITDPESQLKALCSHVISSLSSITGIDNSRIGVSIFIYENNKWKMKIKENIDSSESAANLMNDKETACYNTQHSIDGLIFYPEKLHGENERKYRMHKKDFECNKIGSILSKDISLVIENNMVMNAILNISTYGEIVCKHNDELAKNRIIGEILPNYVNRAQLELSLMYIKHYIFKEGANCPQQSTNVVSDNTRTKKNRKKKK